MFAATSPRAYCTLPSMSPRDTPSLVPSVSSINVRGGEISARKDGYHGGKHDPRRAAGAKEASAATTTEPGPTPTETSTARTSKQDSDETFWCVSAIGEHQAGRKLAGTRGLGAGQTRDPFFLQRARLGRIRPRHPPCLLGLFR